MDRSINAGAGGRGYEAQLKLTNKYAARFGMEDQDGQNNYSSFTQTRHSGNSYMMHRGENYTSYTNRSNIGVVYQPPSQYALAPTSPMTNLGGQTIGTGATIENQDAVGGLAHGH